MNMKDDSDAIISRIEKYHSDKSLNTRKEMALSELNLLQEKELLERETVYSDELMRIAVKRACENIVRVESHLSTIAEETQYIARRILLRLNVIGFLVLVGIAILAQPYIHSIIVLR
jgi:hypothetical protein